MFSVKYHSLFVNQIYITEKVTKHLQFLNRNSAQYRMV